MFWILPLSYPTLVLLGLLSVFLFVIFSDRNAKKQGKAPGPYAVPILGNLLTMAKYADVPTAFSALAKQFGPVVSLRLGSMDCVVLSGLDKMRTVLHTKGHLFDSRPDFQRHRYLFGDDKNNSLAFSDWTDLSKKRRDLIKNHTFPKQFSSMFGHLDSVANFHIGNLISSLEGNPAVSSLHLKPLFSDCMGRIFLQYFVSTEVTDDNYEDFIRMIEAFDFIFQEVNEGCIGDILPSLMFMCNKSHLANVSHSIRNFIVKHCVEPRLAQRQIRSHKHDLKPNRHSVPDMSCPEYIEEVEKARISQSHSVANLSDLDCNNNNSNSGAQETEDLMDDFLNSVGKDNITLDIALYALEDIIGGQSAISNMLTRVFVLLAQNPEVQERIRAEVSDKVGRNPVTLFHRLPYTEATVLESVRHISSPFVPHVAVEDTTIEDFSVAKGTVIFFNTKDLNFSPTLWTKIDPLKFAPERFITADNQIQKPDHFIPFSTGRRSCMGYKIVQHLVYITVANICQRFSVELDPSENYNMKENSLAVGGKGFRFTLKQLD